MGSQADRELLELLSTSRTVFKGLRRQAQAALQLAAELETRLTQQEQQLRNRIAEEAKRHDRHEDPTRTRTLA